MVEGPYTDGTKVTCCEISIDGRFQPPGRKHQDKDDTEVQGQNKRLQQMPGRSRLSKMIGVLSAGLVVPLDHDLICRICAGGGRRYA